MASDIWRVRENRKWSFTNFARFVIPVALFWTISGLSGTVIAASQVGSRGPSPDFSAHSLVLPQLFHGRNKREIRDTRINDFQHEEVLSIGLEIEGTPRTLDLYLNKDLIPAGYKQRRHHNGNYTTEIPHQVELCHYQGTIRNIPNSFVAVSTCHGLNGIIHDTKNMHYIHSNEDTIASAHYLYKDTNLVSNKTCGYEGTPHSAIPANDQNWFRKGSRVKRAIDEVIRGPYNANRQSRYVELVLVIDKTEYIALGENIHKVHHHCKDIANIINALYTPLNIFVALVGVDVWTDTDAIALSPKGDTTLANFLRYRREMLVKAIPNDNAQLLTRVHFDDGVVGKALKGPICTYEFSGGVSMDHSNVIGLVAATVAHEMGHNFGMEHDSVDCSCPEDRCIMASSSGSTGPIHWSSCSLEYLALAFEHGMDYCLRNKPKTLFDSPLCGNGFVESAEQCDCGLKENCDNPCCNASTCMLHPNASCATGECCDLTTCKPKNAGTQCRSAEHECDLPEYCSGQSEYCPNDVYKIDGEACNMGKAFCYQGSCRTHNDQCKLLWGPSGHSSGKLCYEMNNKGSKLGNCGYNRLNSSYMKCDNESLLCGMLHCQHLNERLEFGMESVAILSHSFLNHGAEMIACRSAIVDLGLNEVDPGLAPDGAKCAPGKMCVNQKCMPVADLRASINGGSPCLNSCAGNGVCNSLGHCHCNKGFRPPDCLQPGFGGSDDSGPAEDPNARNDFVTALYIIFLGIVPTVALLSLAVWYKRNNSGPAWKKESISTHDRGFTIETGDRPKRHQSPNIIETIDATLNEDPACTSLLPKPVNDRFNNNSMFGQFKGFTLTPLPPPTPQKISPPLQSIPTAPKPQKKIDKEDFQSAFTLHPINYSKSQSVKCESSDPPKLPPLNPGCTAKLLISSPVLSATTCTSLDLADHKIPSRPAPDIPTIQPDLKTSDLKRPVNSETLRRPEKDQNRDKFATLTRIASILKPGQKMTEYFSKSDESNAHQKANKIIDREILRKLEISNPILQNDIKIPAPVIPLNDPEVEKKNIVTRAQSMKNSNAVARPMIHTFGSMRYSSNAKNPKRPTSIAISIRPTSPPPPVPPIPQSSSSFFNEANLKIPGLPGYQNPPVKMKKPIVDNAYDDCMNLIQDPSSNEPKVPFNDNIYAVIEEPISIKKSDPGDHEYKVPSSSKTVETINKNGEKKSDSDGTMGLLSEIVSEISNRNFDSIYSASSSASGLADARMEGNGSASSLSSYTNANPYKASSIYSNSAKFDSAVSETSSGYLLPSAVNVPKNVGQIGSSIGKKIEVNAEQNGGSMSKKMDVKNLAPTDAANRTIELRTPTKDNNLTKFNKPVVSQLGKSDGSKNSVIGKNAGVFEGNLNRNAVSSSKSGNAETTHGRYKSPDIISSCSSKSVSPTATTSPDIVGVNDSKTISAKVNVTKNGKAVSPVKQTSVKPVIRNFVSPNTKVKTVGAVPKRDSDLKSQLSTREPGKSTVASLQLKFEPNKTATTNPKSGVSKKSLAGKSIGNSYNK